MKHVYIAHHADRLKKLGLRTMADLHAFVRADSPGVEWKYLYFNEGLEEYVFDAVVPASQVPRDPRVYVENADIM